MNPASTEERIRQYIVDCLLNGDPRGLDNDTDLQESGILDSFATIELRAFLEESFRIRVPADKVNLATFRSIRTIADLTRELVENSAGT